MAGQHADDMVDPPPIVASKEVNLYFANAKYVELGNEDLAKMLVDKRVIEYGDGSLEEAIVRELMKGPQDKDKLSTLIPLTVKLINVELTDGTAFVNFAGEGMSGSSMQGVSPLIRL